MYQEIKPYEYANEVTKKLPGGIFLTTNAAGKTNTMTIGWGGINIIWGRPVFIVLVRDSRATYGLIEESNEFTVSVPMQKDMAKELAFCGTRSMRDCDKFKELNIALLPARKVSTPVIKEAGLHYECRVIYKQPLDKAAIPEFIKERYYGPTKPGNTCHTVYYGEIVDQYIYKEGE
ncbi:MAG TPA: flavin reductase family protein [Bacillota bacterium]|nr:flavin reductase family protein [Bacillota bacterium]HPF42812.1 flavin reductase family protein [Bacillota bacterium]HPJ85831.1 flavin reductase family protein [Bacillota bacterium]HPQ61556.1 flavin reductase family protein [Bacillota bacterium]HRX92310.1 flavin reductase family protein [Candidatus Izemoplasmatales bacterium]